MAVRATVLTQFTGDPVPVAAISYDRLHQVKPASEAYREFLAASNGKNPDEEFEARHRLDALEHMK